MACAPRRRGGHQRPAGRPIPKPSSPIPAPANPHNLRATPSSSPRPEWCITDAWRWLTTDKPDASRHRRHGHRHVARADGRLFRRSPKDSSTDRLRRTGQPGHQQTAGRMLGGDIAVASTLGVGTTFTLTIDAGTIENSQVLGASRERPACGATGRNGCGPAGPLARPPAAGRGRARQPAAHFPLADCRRALKSRWRRTARSPWTWSWPPIATPNRLTILGCRCRC